MKTLRIGVAGLGRAFAVMAPAFRDPRVELVAGRRPARGGAERFEQEYAGEAFEP